MGDFEAFRVDRPILQGDIPRKTKSFKAQNCRFLVEFSHKLPGSDSAKATQLGVTDDA